MDKISRRGKLIRELVADFNHNDFLRMKFREENRSVSEFDKPFRYPEHLKTRQIELDKFKMELLSRVDIDSEWVVLQLHGGGYVGPMKNTYRNFAGLYNELGHGINVLTIDYRVAPEDPYPAALEDAICAFDWLLDNGFDEEHIILAGDSAGGGLAMAICHYLKDKDRNLPAGIVAMSPWTDITASGKSYKDNFEIDPIFGNTNENLIYDNPYAKNANPRDPYISPMFGDFEDFPPMLIQVGDHEMLLSDSLEVARKAKEAGGKVRLSVYEGMFHVFQMAAKLMPESRKAWAEVGKFLDNIMGFADRDADAFRIALAQTEIIWEDKQQNLANLESILKSLADRNVKLLLLPEMSFTGFSMNTDITGEPGNEVEIENSDEKSMNGEETENPGGKSVNEAENENSAMKLSTIEEVRKLAIKYNTCIGFGWTQKQGAEEKAKNHYSIIDTEGRLISDYVKLHPFSYSGEDKYFEGGDALALCTLNGMKTGTAICYDLRFGDIFTQMSKYAHLIIVAANWPASRSGHWKTLLRSRAIENQCFIAGVNCQGHMNGLLYSGDSALFGPDGEKQNAEIIVKEDINADIFIYSISDNVEAVRSAFPVAKDRREELYRKLI